MPLDTLGRTRATMKRRESMKKKKKSFLKIGIFFLGKSRKSGKGWKKKEF